MIVAIWTAGRELTARRSYRLATSEVSQAAEDTLDSARSEAGKPRMIPGQTRERPSCAQTEWFVIKRCPPELRWKLERAGRNHATARSISTQVLRGSLAILPGREALAGFMSRGPAASHRNCRKPRKASRNMSRQDFAWLGRWRPRPESNRDARICSPLRNHSATRPSGCGCRGKVSR